LTRSEENQKNYSIKSMNRVKTRDISAVFIYITQQEGGMPEGEGVAVATVGGSYLRCEYIPNIKPRGKQDFL
jgi:hypothetical protein